MFIAFDGIDGAGKNTQIDLLAKHFEGLGKKSIILDMGGLPTFKKIIKEINKDCSQVNSILREVLYYFEGLYTNLEIIQKGAPNDIYIIDRYYLSYLSYGPLNGVPREDVLYFTKYLVEPDFYFYIDVLPEITYERIIKYRQIDAPEIGFKNAEKWSKGNFGKDDYISFQSKVRQNFLNELKSKQILLDGALDGEELHKLIVQQITINH